MKSMQRQFGKVGKRSENEADVQTVLDEFRAVDSMLDLMLKELTNWRNSWQDILRYQYDTSEAFAVLYKPIEPVDDPEMRHQPAATPPEYLQKCLGLQKEYADVKGDLAQEIEMINKKLIAPVEDAKRCTKMLHKTIKHRENMKLDYERYLGRAQHGQKKEMRSAKEEAKLAVHEDKLVQARIDYETADDQVKQTFPPVSAAIMELLPPILTGMVMLQTTLVGQLYTVVDAYTRQAGFPNPAPGNNEILSAWDGEFTSFRKELESGLRTIAKGKAVNLNMNLPPEKDKTTVSGYGIRNKILHRDQKEIPIPVRPIGRKTSFNSASDISSIQEEQAPPKPPRPGGAAQVPSTSPYSIPKTRVPSAGTLAPYPTSANTNNYSTSPSMPDSRFLASSPKPSLLSSPPAYTTPPSRYLTPANGRSPQPSPEPSNRTDYFPTNPLATRRPSAQSTNSSTTTSSLAVAAAAAAKKKPPPPPIPAKRIPSGPQPQFVTALYDFEGQNQGDLAFREGDRIKVLKKTESTDDWWEGEVAGRRGAFPANYVAL